MDNLEFLSIVHSQFAHCVDVLEEKRPKYEADNDRLSSFKATQEPLLAWRSLAQEHFIKLQDMIRDVAKGGYLEVHSKEEWRKVITHQLNWLFLLSALLKELSDEE